MIRNLKAFEITTSSVFLDWDKPIGMHSYFKVQWTGDKTDKIKTTDTSYNITGLTAGAQYTFNVTTVARDNLTEGDPAVTQNYTSTFSNL